MCTYSGSSWKPDRMDLFICPLSSSLRAILVWWWNRIVKNCILYLNRISLSVWIIGCYLESCRGTRVGKACFEDRGDEAVRFQAIVWLRKQRCRKFPGPCGRDVARERGAVRRPCPPAWRRRPLGVEPLHSGSGLGRRLSNTSLLVCIAFRNSLCP